MGPRGFAGMLTRSVYLATAILALAGGQALATDYWVDPTGSGGLGNGTRTFITPQAAFAAIPAGTAANPTRVLVYPSTYTGQCTVNKNFVDVIGLGADPSQTVFTDNLTTTIQNATFTVTTNHFTASNVTFANSTPNGSNGHPTVQALAMADQGDENAFQNCNFNGFQDTLYNAGGRAYFNTCTITGIHRFHVRQFDRCHQSPARSIVPPAAQRLTAANTSSQHTRRLRHHEQHDYQFRNESDRSRPARGSSPPEATPTSFT